MNAEKTNSWQPPAKAKLHGLGIIIIVAIILALLSIVIKNETHMKASFAFLFDYIEIISSGCFIILLILLGIPIRSQRPFFHVPWEAAWWEFFIFGITTTIFSLVYLVSLVGGLIVLPLIVPIKVIYVYAFGPHANLLKAVIAIPIVIFTVGLAFTIVYVTCILKGRGALLDKGTDLYTDWKKRGLDQAALSTFYFSVSTFLGGFATPYEPQGWCRWIALVQLVVGKILEVVLIGVGIAILITKMSVPHP